MAQCAICEQPEGGCDCTVVTMAFRSEDRAATAGRCIECGEVVKIIDGLPYYDHKGEVMHWPGCFHTRMSRMYEEVKAMHAELKGGTT